MFRILVIMKTISICLRNFERNIILISFIVQLPVSGLPCHSHVNDAYGLAKTAFYPKNYEARNCTWTIKTQNGTSILLTFLDFDIYSSQNCQKDYVQVIDSINKTSLYDVRLCGSDIPPTVQSSGNQVEVLIFSTKGIGRGFQLEWRVGSELTLHPERKTWSEARDICSREGGSLLTHYYSKHVINLTSSYNVADIWKGYYLTPWAWTMGCYTFETWPNFTKQFESKSNQLKECLNFCSDFNFFGLQFRYCYCFNTFAGRFVSTADECTQKCPGNIDETCGSLNSITMTIYMNDVCYKKNVSEKWKGTISRSFSGQECMPWSEWKTSFYTFPDGSAENASNFCRDPDSSGYLWCHVNYTNRERCDIPPCIEAVEDNNELCMAFKKTKDEPLVFIQQNCNEFEFGYLHCMTDLNNSVYNGRLDGNNIKSTWQVSRNLSSQSQCKCMAGPMIHRMSFHVNIIKNNWLGYSRNVSSESEIKPNIIPKKCYTLSVAANGTQNGFVSCSEQHSFICQKEPVFCGEHYDDSFSGTFLTPGYHAGEYGKRLNCEWKISAAAGHILSVNVDVDLESSYNCSADSIKLYDGSSLFGSPLCGKNTAMFSSSTGNVTIKFKSDDTFNNKGANITWWTVAVPTTPSSTTTSDKLTPDDNKVTVIVGSISAVVVVVVVLIAIMCVCVKRKTKSSIVRQRKLDSSNSDTNPNIGTTAKLLNSTPENNEIPLTEFYEAVPDDLSIQPNVTYGKVNKHKIKRNITSFEESNGKKILYRNNPDDDKNVYNNTPEQVDKKYNNHGENIYNKLNNTSDIYDHTNTAIREHQNKSVHLPVGTDNVYHKVEDVQREVYQTTSSACQGDNTKLNNKSDKETSGDNNQHYAAEVAEPAATAEATDNIYSNLRKP